METSVLLRFLPLKVFPSRFKSDHSKGNGELFRFFEALLEKPIPHLLGRMVGLNFRCIVIPDHLSALAPGTVSQAGAAVAGKDGKEGDGQVNQPAKNRVGEPGRDFPERRLEAFP